MTKRKGLIFDLDGTLLDTIDDLRAALNIALEKHGYPARTREETLSFVGNGIGVLVERALPGGRENPAYPAVLSDFKAYYNDHMSDLTRPYNGIPELLRSLADEGFLLAIVSNKFDAAVKALATRYFPELALLAIGESEKIARKPAPDAVLHVLGQWGMQPENCFYIGDSEIDLATARAAGVLCLSVTWGFRNPEFLIENGATRLFDTPEELRAYLLSPGTADFSAGGA